MENDDDKISVTNISKLDLASTRATEWRNNKRVVITTNDDENEEIRRAFMKEELLKVVDEYTEKFCDKKGRIIENNFTKDEEATLKEL